MDTNFRHFELLLVRVHYTAVHEHCSAPFASIAAFFHSLCEIRVALTAVFEHLTTASARMSSNVYIDACFQMLELTKS